MSSFTHPSLCCFRSVFAMILWTEWMSPPWEHSGAEPYLTASSLMPLMNPE